MRWLFLILIGWCIILARPASAVQLHLASVALTTPVPQASEPPPEPFNRAGALGAAIPSGLALNAILGYCVVFVPYAVVRSLGHGAELGHQDMLGFSITALLAMPLLSSAAVYAITSYFGGHPSFWRMLVSSLVVRTVVTGIFLAADWNNPSSTWLWGTLAFAPLAGVSTELVVAQFDFSSASEPAPMSPTVPVSNRPHAPLVPVLAMAF